MSCCKGGFRRFPVPGGFGELCQTLDSWTDQSRPEASVVRAVNESNGKLGVYLYACFKTQPELKRYTDFIMKKKGAISPPTKSQTGIRKGLHYVAAVWNLSAI